MCIKEHHHHNLCRGESEAFLEDEDREWEKGTEYELDAILCSTVAVVGFGC